MSLREGILDFVHPVKVKLGKGQRRNRRKKNGWKPVFTFKWYGNLVCSAPGYTATVTL